MTDEPEPTVDPRYSVHEAPPVSWSDAEQTLGSAGTYWISTVRSDGRPHVTPLIAMWQNGALYFSTGRSEQKYKNLDTNPQCVLTTGSNQLDQGLDVVVEGEAVRITDPARLQQLAQAWRRKYGDDWPLGGGADSDDVVFEVTPTKVFGFRKEFGDGGRGSQTRWRWVPS
ncbi:pyridoxamine 5'-phosphate oxidase family protein [Desertimonas flava]|uniref:pyridoxamine 5'-phosphate oxidase family protein n=1 Tax=Desertimonas flava TaxID=2064846 RepID=UPI000E34BC2D|nr:pyridoxamine 5'-phosphate oxidase family protein [Desertimonas flava]